MKATLLICASIVVLGLIGCSDNPSSPSAAQDQTVSSSLTKGGGNILLSDGGSQGRGRRDSSRVKGMITAVDTIAGTVTIRTRVIQTDSSTTIEKNGRHVRLSALQVGDRGEARLRAGSTVASSVEAEGPGGEGHELEDAEVRGMVTAVDTTAGTLTIGTTVVPTNAQTQIERNHQHVVLSAIQVGDRGEARIPTGATFASRVEAESH